MDLSKLTDIRSGFGDFKKGYKVKDKKEFGIVRDTLTKLGLSVTNFDNNLLTLLIDEGDNSFFPAYDKKRNQIKNAHPGFELVHELFHLSSRSDKDMGCVINGNIGVSLNEGITDYLTYLSSDGKYEIRYVLEALVAKELVNIYGNDLLNKFVLGKPKDFYKTFDSFFDDFVDVLTVLDDYTMEFVKTSNIINNIANKRVSDFEYNPDDLSYCFNDAIFMFFDFLESIDKKYCEDFYKELETTFNEDNEIVKSIKSIVKESCYKSVDEIFNRVKESYNLGGNYELK